MRPSEIIDKYRNDLRTIAHRHGVTNVRVFGSVARQEDHEDSDIDLLVDAGEDTSLFDLARIRVEVRDLTGCEIDIHTSDSFHPKFHQKIAKDVTPL